MRKRSHDMGRPTRDRQAGLDPGGASETRSSVGRSWSASLNHGGRLWFSVRCLSQFFFLKRLDLERRLMNTNLEIYSFAFLCCKLIDAIPY
jgi:hypothetical protein